ncbi:MAG TPA: AraC family transcriptional regulator [Terriglobales bacterium]|nr:AraC family transcriptional regulator [Terriglobales bacterium]
MAPRIHKATQHKLSIRGLEAVSFVSNHHFPRHAHDQFGIGLVTQGAQRSWSGIGSVRAGPGDCIMANPGEIHDGIPLEGKPRAWSMIYLDPGLVTEELGEELVGGAVELVCPVARDPLLKRHFTDLFTCLTIVPTDNFGAEERLLRCLVCLMERHGAIRPRFAGPAPCVQRALRRMTSAPEQKLSLAELAALSGVSRFQFLRGFMRSVGSTPHAYLVQMRVRLARRLLAEGQTPAQAAAIAGFADQSHMTRAFVRLLGVTPSRYRAAIS